MEERKALGIVHPKDGEEVYRQRCMVKGWGEPKTEYILSVKRFPEISSFDRTRGAPMLPEINYKVKTSGTGRWFKQIWLDYKGSQETVIRICTSEGDPIHQIVVHCRQSETEYLREMREEMRLGIDLESKQWVG